MNRVRQGLIEVGVAALSAMTWAEAPAKPPKPAVDAELARSTGADDGHARVAKKSF